MADAQTPRAYITIVLAGYDHNGCFTDANATYDHEHERNPNCIVIRAKPDQSIEDAIKALKLPANIPVNFILDCHGAEDGTFAWNKDESVSYSRLLSALKALQDKGTNIESATFASCFGGTAIFGDLLTEVPGIILQTLVSGGNVGNGGFVSDFARSACKGGSSTDLYIQSLAAFNPEKYKQNVDYWNTRDKTHNNDDPENALPHIIGVGGNPPVEIYLNGKIEEMQNADSLNPAAWKAAIDETRKKFGASAGTSPTDVMRKMWSGKTPEGGAENYIAINIVAEKIRSGEQIKGAQLERYAYALAAAYLDKSGELARLVEVTKNNTLTQYRLSRLSEKQFNGFLSYHLSDLEKIEHLKNAKDLTRPEQEAGLVKLWNHLSEWKKDDMTTDIETRVRYSELEKAQNPQQKPAPAGAHSRANGIVPTEAVVSLSTFQDLNNKLLPSADGKIVAHPSGVAAQFKNPSTSIDKA